MGAFPVKKTKNGQIVSYTSRLLQLNFSLEQSFQKKERGYQSPLFRKKCGYLCYPFEFNFLFM
jgi:hypothetical protein